MSELFCRAGETRRFLAFHAKVWRVSPALRMMQCLQMGGSCYVDGGGMNNLTAINDLSESQNQSKRFINNTSLKWCAISSVLFACIFYLSYLIHAIYVERALYADGANFFIDLLNRQSAWPVADDSKHIRLFANLVNQFPVVVALKNGVEEFRVLKLLFGAGLFLIPLFIYLYCFYLSCRAGRYHVFFLSMASLITCAIPSDIFILNQSFLALAFSWVLIHYVLLQIDIKWIDCVVIALVSIILFRAHESLMLWGGVILVGSIAIIAIRDKMVVNNKNLHIYSLGGVGFALLLFVLFWQSTHPVAQQTDAFLQLIKLAAPAELWKGNTRISVLTLLFLVAAFAYSLMINRFKNINYLFSWIFITVSIVISCGLIYTGVSAIYDYSLTDPFREYSYRFLMTFGSTAWMLLAIAFSFKKIPFDLRAAYAAVFALALGLISASIWQISSNIQWAAFKNAAATQLQASEKPLLLPESVRDQLISENKEYAYKYRWGWAWPVFGVSLQENGQIDRLYRPEGPQENFKPPTLLPFVDFSNKGIFEFKKFNLLCSKTQCLNE
ncbi:MAG: hypothetical protein NT086_14965 [Proteobacteria bacterium]|nr:hypothetical protein [Pseudomonadota bacterium]